VDGLDDAPHPDVTRAQPEPQNAVADEPEPLILENAPAAASERSRPADPMFGVEHEGQIIDQDGATIVSD
jgi:hypothetical protein